MFRLPARIQSILIALCIFVICISLFPAPLVRANVDDPLDRAPAVTAPILPGHVAHPILGDLRVRRAIAYCTDRDALIQSIYPELDEAQRASLLYDTILTTGSWAYNPATIKYTHNITLANLLLTQAGWTLAPGDTYRHNSKGQELALSYKTTWAPIRMTYGSLWVEQLAQCGIHALPEFLNPADWFGDTLYGGTTYGQLTQRRFELGGYAFVASVDRLGNIYACDNIPTPTNLWVGQNYPAYCDPQTDELIYQSIYALHRDEVQALYWQIQDNMATDLPVLPLFMRGTGSGAVLYGVTGFSPVSEEPIYTWNAAQWQKGVSDTIRIGMTIEPAELCCSWDGLVERDLINALIYGRWSTTLNFEHQPRYYTAIPTLENGGIVTHTVNVTAGMRVADYTQQQWITLTVGNTVPDVNGNKLVYNGGAISMTQATITTSFISGLKWSDGSNLIQADLQLYDRIRCDPVMNNYAVCEGIAAMRYVTHTTVAYTLIPGLSPAYPLSPYLLPGAFPSQRIVTGGVMLQDVPAAEFKSLPEIAEHPIGFGPYMLLDWQKGVSMTLTANPYHALGAPQTPNIEVMYLPEDQVIAQLQNGSIDLVGPESTTSIWRDMLVASNTGDFQSFIVPGVTWEHIDFNLSLQFYALVPVVMRE